MAKKRNNIFIFPRSCAVCGEGDPTSVTSEVTWADSKGRQGHYTKPYEPGINDTPPDPYITCTYCKGYLCSRHSTHQEQCYVNIIQTGKNTREMTK